MLLGMRTVMMSATPRISYPIQAKLMRQKNLTNDSGACSNHLKQDNKTQDTIANSLNSRSSKKLESQRLSSEPLQPVLFFPAYRGHSDYEWH